MDHHLVSTARHGRWAVVRRAGGSPGAAAGPLGRTPSDVWNRRPRSRTCLDVGFFGRLCRRDGILARADARRNRCRRSWLSRREIRAPRAIALEWPAMPRPRSVSRSGETVITNGELARIFNEIGDMLEILGEVVYKAVAYRRVADIVERYPDDVAALYRRGEPPKIPGAGPALNAKLAELAETGRLDYH